MPWHLLLPEGSGMRCTKGSMTNAVMIETVILTEFGSSSHTYKSTYVIKETVAAMKKNTSAISGEEGGHGRIVNTGRSQCHMTQTDVRLTP